MTTAAAPVQLTERQQQIFDFLAIRIKGGLPPTVREIGHRHGISSPNGVMCHLKALEKKGLIRRDPHVSRSIYLTDSELNGKTWTSKALQPSFEQLMTFSLSDLNGMAERVGVFGKNKGELALALAGSGKVQITSRVSTP